MVLDAFPHWAKRKTVVVGTVCLLGFLLCLPFTIKGGNGWVQFLYGYVNGFCLLLNAVLEVIVVGWVYGADRFLDDIEAMIGRRPSNWWKVCWKFVVPICLVGLILWRLVDKGSKGADIINVCGWMMAFSPLFAVTFAMLYQLCRRPMVEPWPAKFQALLTPNGKWHRGNVPRPVNSINTVSNINDEFDAKTSLKEAWCRRENINKERLEAVSDSTLTSSTSGSTSLVLSVRDSRKKQRPRHVSILEVSEEMATSVRRFRDPASSGETSPKK
ncbi:sodium- and chloride-dependent taurine transporter-like [Littorina saxatilis]|uniref:sodium- and chloride-dependent taurine transporter-like n=1 Tax=Littorina saxatilis TaxID=31220 RepID=UPI0038B67FDD